jgi:hypothetical protein
MGYTDAEPVVVSPLLGGYLFHSLGGPVTAQEGG